MNLFSESNYKTIIRQRVKEFSRTRRKLTLQKLAGRIAIQNSYLSRALNDEKTHLNEDHLYKVCKILEFFPQEIDYVFLLRAKANTDDPERRSFLDDKLNRLRQSDQRSANFQEFDNRTLNEEIAYLFDPLCNLVMVAMFIEDYRVNPRKLCAPLGISVDKLKQVLHKLSNLNFIELGDDAFTVIKVHSHQIHYGTDHPLMRTHQNLLRGKSSTHLGQVPEEEKHCFMGTFSADLKTFEKIKTRFQAFMKEAEQLIADAPSEQVFQINFDLFKWL
jgi:uncharacterized protein (TIGR02147 family)